jgi:hypothetical protein
VPDPFQQQAGFSRDTISSSVDLLCDAFEQAWRAGAQPRIEEYLTNAADAERAALLHELLGIELELRRERGEQPSGDEYVAAFPNMAR